MSDADSGPVDADSESGGEFDPVDADSESGGEFDPVDADPESGGEFDPVEPNTGEDFEPVEVFPDSDDFDLQMSPSAADEVDLGSLPKAGRASPSGINLGSPKDSGVWGAPHTLDMQLVFGNFAAPGVIPGSGPDAEGGRGLLIVSALARSWGTERLSAGKCVWFELGRVGRLEPA